MYKLLMRAFPGWYRANSVYALYPFTTVEGNLEILQDRSTAKDFDFNKPSLISPPIPITSWKGVVDVLSDQEHFKVPCENPSLLRVLNSSRFQRLTSLYRGKPHI